MKVRVDFGPWLPDVPALKLGVSGVVRAENVVPQSGGWAGVPGPLRMTQALPAACVGLTGFLRQNSGTPVVMAGTSSNLYWLGANPYSWTEKSVGTGAYAVTAGSYWEFAAWRNLLVAVARGVAPQKWVLTLDPATGGNKWAALGGTPPQFDHVCVSAEFVFGGNVYSGGTRYETRVQWSANANAEDWTVSPGTTQASFIDLEDGGAVKKLVGGEFVTVLQERAIRRLTYIGYPGLFQSDRISDRIGTRASRSVVTVAGAVYFLSDDGFYVLGPEGLMRIGVGKIDRWFWGDVKEQYVSQIQGVADPAKMLIYWFYVSRDNTSLTPVPDKAICYHYGTGDWSSLAIPEPVELAGEWVSPAWTLDQIGAHFPDLDQIGISLDDAFWSGGVTGPVSFASDHKLSAPAGKMLAATVESADIELLPGRKAWVRTVRPLVDGASATAAMGTRSDTRDSIVWGAAAAQSSRGLCAARAVGRFQRVRISTAAGAAFDRLVGAELDATTAGT